MATMTTMARRNSNDVERVPPTSAPVENVADRRQQPQQHHQQQQQRAWPRHSSRSQFWPRHHDMNRGASVRTSASAEHQHHNHHQHHRHHQHPQHQHPQHQHPQHQPQQHSPPLQSLNFQAPPSGPLLYRAFPQLAQPLGAMAVFVGAPLPPDQHRHHRGDHPHSQERQSWSRIHPTDGVGPGHGTVNPAEYEYHPETYHHRVGNVGAATGLGAGAEHVATPEALVGVNPNVTAPVGTDSTEAIDDLALCEEGDYDADDDADKNDPPQADVGPPQSSSVVASGGDLQPTVAELKTDDGHAEVQDNDDDIILDGGHISNKDSNEEKETESKENKSDVPPNKSGAASATRKRETDVPDEVMYVGSADDDGEGAINAGAVPPPRSAAATPDTVGGASAVSALTAASMGAGDDNELPDLPISPRLPPSYDNYRSEFGSRQLYAHGGGAGSHIPPQHAGGTMVEHQQMPMYGQGHVLPSYSYEDQVHAQAQAHAFHKHQHHYYNNVDPSSITANQDGNISKYETIEDKADAHDEKREEDDLQGVEKREEDDLQDVSISSPSDNSSNGDEHEDDDESVENDSFDDETDASEAPAPISLSMLENSGGARRRASPDSKYETYACRVDPTQSDRSTEIFLFSASRPHMRGFHFAWIGFFIAMATWFAIAPLLSEVQISLDISKEQIWTSSIWGSAGTVIFRVTNGPLCDKYGARWVMGITLLFSGVPAMMTGLVQTATGLSFIRTLIGVAGSAFVMCQYWTATMFTREVAGTALSLAAGWGNLGGAVTNVVMGSVLFPIFKWSYGGESAPKSSDKAWRTACIIPGLLSVVWGIITIKFADDCPKGNYRKRRRLGLMSNVSVWTSLFAASKKLNTWLMFVQYACCFGVEVTMTNAAALYFSSEFGLTTASAAAVASIFGWMNLFARGLGGFCSDMANVSYGMRGRLMVQWVFLFLEGAMVVIFGYSPTLGGSIVSMIFFSLFVQTSEGSSYAVVPYIKPSATGSVSGLIGAGGALGGVLFPILFQRLDYRNAFRIMGWCALASSFLTPLIVIKGHDGIFSKCTQSDSEDASDGRTHDAKGFDNNDTSGGASKNYDSTIVRQSEEKNEENDSPNKEEHISSPEVKVIDDQAEDKNSSEITESHRGEESVVHVEIDDLPAR